MTEPIQQQTTLQTLIYHVFCPIKNHKKSLKIPERIRKSKTDRQRNGQNNKDKRTNNDLQNIWT